MPIVLNSAQVVAAVMVNSITVPVERVEPIVVNEPITVQVRRCNSVPVYVNVSRGHERHLRKLAHYYNGAPAP